MKTKDFYFDLPEQLIAQYPADRRGTSRLLVLDRKSRSCTHSEIDHIRSFMPEDVMIVVNNSKVRKARVYAQTEYAGTVEFLFLEQTGPVLWKIISTKSKRQKVGRTYTLPNGAHAEILEDHGSTKILKTSQILDESFFDEHGHMPLPPYIKREDEFADGDRYQTVYAHEVGSVAAPTAGLHFTESIMDDLRAHDVKIVPVTLHVGLGTFLPIRSEDITEHTMHTEEYEISEEAAAEINRHREQGKPILAVGTTSVRTLESAYDKDLDAVVPGRRSTDIYITPGYRFNVVDALLTNFHTPESTLLILVSAFADRELIFSAYEQAIEKEYRFFSYGDAMLIL